MNKKITIFESFTTIFNKGSLEIDLESLPNIIELSLNETEVWLENNKQVIFVDKSKKRIVSIEQKKEDFPSLEKFLLDREIIYKKTKDEKVYFTIENIENE